MQRRPPGEEHAWRLLLVVSATALPVGTAALVVVMARGGTGAVQPAVVVVAAALLHVAAWRAAQRPVSAFVVAASAMAALALVSPPGWSSAVWVPSSLCFLLVLWRLVTAGPRRWTGPALGVAVTGAALAVTAAAVRAPGGARVPVWAPVLEAALLVAAVTTVWALARATRGQRERAAVRSAEHLALVRRTERAQVRRDLHDVISHSLTLVVAQAEAARTGTREPETDRALAQVAETGRTALLGLRAMLRVLDAPPAAAGQVVPSLEGLPALVAAASTPLHRVTLSESGHPRAMPADAEAALVRLVQEGITNALRHVEPPLDVAVHLAWDVEEGGGAVEVRVQDDGGAGPRTAGGPGGPVGTGSGLTDAARRVEDAGGVLHVEPGRGWTLRARLPAVGAS